MNTFLPYADFAQSASCLDRLRLGKQRIECLQIFKANLGLTRAWQNHPATKMWADYEWALYDYAKAICAEWACRGYRDQCLAQMESLLPDVLSRRVYPEWLGDAKLHLSHQSNLVRKLPAHYRAFFPDVPANLPYVWPTKMVVGVSHHR